MNSSNDPDRAPASYRRLGDRQLESGHAAEAALAYTRAIALDPCDVAALFGLGNAQAAQGDFAQAAAAFDRVLALRPGMAAAHFNKANAECAMGRFEGAVASYRRAVDIEPRATVYNNLGTALGSLNRGGEAVEALREAVALDPKLLTGHTNLVKALADHGRLPAAIDACHRALEIRPRSASLLELLGRCWLEMHAPSNARACFERAIKLEPDNVDLHAQLGDALYGENKLEEACSHYEAALRLAPSRAEVRSNLGEVLRTRGLLREAVACYREALVHRPGLAGAHSNLLLTLLYEDQVSGADVLAEARDWARRHAAGIPRLSRGPRRPDPGRCLNIGYVSGSFRNHPVGYFIEPVLRHHDRARVKVHCYPSQPSGDDLTCRLRQLADVWADVYHEDDAGLAQRIDHDGIDILVDLSGHTSCSRLLAFARKPAPLQVTWAGYSATTGLGAIDYILADRWVIPEGEESMYVEEVVRLPRNYVCFAAPPFDIEPGRPTSSRTGRFTFGCFNNRAKLTSAVVRAWAEILHDTPDSQLLLQGRAFGDTSVRRALGSQFGDLGVSEEQLRMEADSPREGLLAAYREVDLCLDPFPFNGGVTTLESLWMGVPVLTLRGDRFVGHAGESFLSAVGLDELVADSPDDYRALAVGYASDPARLAASRHRLRERFLASSLCDGARFTRDLERAYRRMWSRHCERGRS